MSDQVVEATDAPRYAPDIERDIAAGLAKHEELAQAMARVDEILAERRAIVLRIRARGVSGYELAKVFHVSQTTIGNWCSPKQ